MVQLELHFWHFHSLSMWIWAISGRLKSFIGSVTLFQKHRLLHRIIKLILHPLHLVTNLFFLILLFIIWVFLVFPPRASNLSRKSGLIDQNFLLSIHLLFGFIILDRAVLPSEFTFFVLLFYLFQSYATGYFGITLSGWWQWFKGVLVVEREVSLQIGYIRVHKKHILANLQILITTSDIRFASFLHGTSTTLKVSVTLGERTDVAGNVVSSTLNVLGFLFLNVWIRVSKNYLLRSHALNWMILKVNHLSFALIGVSFLGCQSFMPWLT